MPIMSEDIKEIAKALGEAQGKIKNVAKENSGYQYKYADLGNCINAIKEPLREQGLAITQVIDREEGELVLCTLLMHTSGQWIKSSFPLNAAVVSMQNKMHALGSSISYARRYSLAAIIGLAQEDDDGHSAASNKQEPQKSTKNTPPLSPIDKLKILCDDHNVNIREFAQFHKLSSKDIVAVTRMVDNFHDHYIDYVAHIEGIDKKS